MRINYHKTTSLWLHFEDFYNAGYTPKQIKDIIESLTDFNGLKFHCERIGINGNWIVQTCEDNPFYHEWLISIFHEAIISEKPELGKA